MKRFLHTVFYILLVASFAMWFGGFGFYVSFVVPIGTEVLESSFDQGMITRRVTVPLNWLGLLASSMLLLNSALTWKITSARVRHVLVWAAAIMLLAQWALFWLHPQIDAFVDLKAGEISGDYDRFYLLHRLYLWGSTIQWLVAWVWLAAWTTSIGLTRRFVKTSVDR